MSILSLILWALVGTGLALFVLVTQHWSVMRINPQKPGYSQGLIIGGAFIRWLTIVTFLFLALHTSAVAMITTFFSFLISKLVILAIWNWAILNNKHLKLGAKWKL